MADLSDDQLRQLCAALGWQGGTFHQVLEAMQQRGWQPIATAPKKHGAQVLGWFRKVKLDEDDNLTDEVVGGAIAQVSRSGEGWDEPDWLNASGAYFFDDFSFEAEPVLWHPLPPNPTVANGVDSCPPMDSYVVAQQGPQPGIGALTPEVPYGVPPTTGEQQ
jgi:hypothetical protein